jgi:hypothetical protein
MISGPIFAILSAAVLMVDRRRFRDPTRVARPEVP